MDNSDHRRRRALAAGALLAGLAACGGSGSDTAQAPLAITSSNAPAVAAEAVITADQAQATVTAFPGSSAALAAGARQLAHAVAQAPHADPVTESCGVSGTITTAMTATSATVTFAACVDAAGTSVNGMISYSALAVTTTGSGTAISASVSVNITATVGSLSYAESGGYNLMLTVGSSSGGLFSLTGDHLSLAVSGAVQDKVTLSSFDIQVTDDTTASPAETDAKVDYELDTTRLAGHISVSTTHDMKQLETGEHPYAGTVLITGANHGRLQIAIHGDETYTPPAGQGQVELQVDTGTGSFGASIWVSWDMLTALAQTSS
jgi:hypothetical protein